MSNNVSNKESRKTGEKVINLNIIILAVAILCVICSIATAISMSSKFEETYSNAFIPRYNVQVAIDDIKTAVDDDNLTEAERLETIRSSIEVLEEEITNEK